jgi:hypothetical protein
MAMTCFLESMPSEMTAGLNLSKYGSASAYVVRSAS